MIDLILRDSKLHPGAFIWRGPLLLSAIEDWERARSLSNELAGVSPLGHVVRYVNYCDTIHAQYPHNIKKRPVCPQISVPRFSDFRFVSADLSRFPGLPATVDELRTSDRSTGKLVRRVAYTPRMRTILLAFFFAPLFLPATQAQDMLGKISCHAFGMPKAENPEFKKKLWDGYEISLGPARNSQGGGDECTAAIYNSAGRVVYRTTGYNVLFDENHTGQDFDGDGKPEVVFITDTGGGNHCCWAYNVISLAPKPHKLFDIDAPGAVRFEKDEQGKMVIWRRLPGPYDFTSMAGTPFAEKAFRVREGDLSDATPEFCSRIFRDDNKEYRFWKDNLSKENLKKLQSTGDSDVENEEIVSALLSRALQHVFCRQFDAALDDLNLWPESSRAKMKAAFARSIEQEYRDFAVRLVQGTN